MFDLSGKKSEIIKTFKMNLMTSSAWASRGIVRIYEFQTAQEKNAQFTIEKNKKGFNASDAYMLSSFAKQLLDGKTLSAKQLAIAYRKMPKYAGQLYALAMKDIPFGNDDFKKANGNGRPARGGINSD